MNHTSCESDGPRCGEEDRNVKRRRHTPEQVIRKLAEGEKWQTALISAHLRGEPWEHRMT
jgi:hypothetical protein